MTDRIMRNPNLPSDGPGGPPPSPPPVPNGPMDDSYLWDKSGTPDPDVVRLENLLAPARMKMSLPAPASTPDSSDAPTSGRVHVATPRSRGPKRRKNAWVLPAVGTLALFALIAVIAWDYRPWDLNLTDWKAEALDGKPTIDGLAISKPLSVTFDTWMTTDATSRLQLSVSQFGKVIVHPGSTVRIKKIKDGEHWFELKQGSIKATITAPPKLFFVETPTALAVDMGCEYSLEVDATGEGTLHVTGGWVELQRKTHTVRVPQGKKCAIYADTGPGTPVNEHASDFLVAAVERFDRRSNPKFASKSDLVGDILASTGAKSLTNDAVTLWHLLREVDAGDRQRVLVQLASLVPLPAGVKTDAILSLDPIAMDQWWESVRVR
jgi:hypothetical protein